MTNLPSVAEPKPTKKSKAKSKSQTAQPESLIESHAKMTEKLVASADQIFQRMAAGLNPGKDAGWVFAQLDLDQQDIEGRVRRCQRVEHHKKIAGTREDLSRDQAELERLEIESRDKAEQLQAEIGERERELQKILDKPRELQRRISERQQASQILRTLVPDHVKARHARELQMLKESDLGSDMRSAESRLRLVENILEKYSEPAPSCEAATRHANQLPNATEMLVATRRGQQLNLASWKNYIADLRNEKPKIEKRLSDLREEYDSRKAEIDTLLDHFLN